MSNPGFLNGPSSCFTSQPDEGPTNGTITGNSRTITGGDLLCSRIVHALNSRYISYIPQVIKAHQDLEINSFPSFDSLCKSSNLGTTSPASHAYSGMGRNYCTILFLHLHGADLFGIFKISLGTNDETTCIATSYFLEITGSTFPVHPYDDRHYPVLHFSLSSILTHTAMDEPYTPPSDLVQDRVTDLGVLTTLVIASMDLRIRVRLKNSVLIWTNCGRLKTSAFTVKTCGRLAKMLFIWSYVSIRGQLMCLATMIGASPYHLQSLEIRLPPTTMLKSHSSQDSLIFAFLPGPVCQLLSCQLLLFYLQKQCQQSCNLATNHLPRVGTCSTKLYGITRKLCFPMTTTICSTRDHQVYTSFWYGGSASSKKQVLGCRVYSTNGDATKERPTARHVCEGSYQPNINNQFTANEVNGKIL